MPTPTTPEPRPHIVTDLVATDPWKRIAEAIEWCCQQGIRVLVDPAPRVKCTSHFAPNWVAEGDSVGVIGACILRRQPQTCELDTAAIMALGQTKRWIEAFAVGLSGRPKPKEWEDHVASRLMTHGYLMGLDIQTRASMDVCNVHRDTAFPRGGSCPKCDDEAAMTPIDPNAGQHS